MSKPVYDDIFLGPHSVPPAYLAQDTTTYLAQEAHQSMCSGINLPLTSSGKGAASPTLNFLFVSGDNSRLAGGGEYLVISHMWGVYHGFLTDNRCSVSVRYLVYIPQRM